MNNENNLRSTARLGVHHADGFGGRQLGYRPASEWTMHALREYGWHLLGQRAALLV